MALRIKTTGAADYGRYVKALITGPPGSGKTVLGSTAPTPLLVSAEGGLMSVADRSVKYAEIETTLELEQLRAVLEQPEDVRTSMLGFGPETIVLDTIDEIQKIFERERLKVTKKESLTMQDFGWLKDRMLDVISSYRNLPMNVVFLCHTKEVTDEEMGTVSVKPGLKGGVADEIAAYMDIVGVITVEEYLDIDGDEAVSKNRHVLSVQPDRRHGWLKDRSWKLPPRIVLNGKNDFKRIHATVFKDMTEPAPVAEGVEITPPEPDPVEQIERVPEQPANPIKDQTTDDDAEATTEATTTETKETAAK